MAETKKKYLFKFIIIGDEAVGKTTLVHKFIHSEYKEESVSTIGVEFGVKEILIHDHMYKLQLWDTAGQEKYFSITRSYYNSVNGVILAYDITNKKSFDNIERWLHEVNLKLDGTKNVIKILVGLKSDLESKRVVTKQEALYFADNHNCKFLEVSSKSGINVNEVFVLYLNEFVTQYENEINKIDIKLPKESKSKCC